MKLLIDKTLERVNLNLFDTKMSRIPKSKRYIFYNADKPWYTENRFEIISGEPYIRIKRFLDIIASLFLIILILPVLVLCAIAIFVDNPGSIIFTQQRTGFGGKRFRMYKLRSMHRNAEAMKKDLMHLNILQYPDFKIINDPRITRVGRILRKTSLDELPQIFNVLKGDMSLIGPRPTSFHPSTYQLWHTVRLEIKPGVTGLWQVTGRNDVEFDDRIRLDYAYMRNISLGLDLKILLRTFSSVINKEGA